MIYSCIGMDVVVQDMCTKEISMITFSLWCTFDVYICTQFETWVNYTSGKITCSGSTRVLH